MNVVKIYTLTNPISGLVFYVGATASPLLVRLRGHGRRASVKAIREAGLHPIITCVEECSLKNASKKETYWIKKFLRQGAPLENKMISNFAACKRLGMLDDYGAYLSSAIADRFSKLNPAQIASFFKSQSLDEHTYQRLLATKRIQVKESALHCLNRKRIANKQSKAA